MPHTHAAPPIPPVTPETQAPPQTLGRESRRKSWMVRCSPPPHASGFSRNNHHNFELTLSPLSLEISGKKRWNLRLTLRHSSFNKTWNTKDATTTDPKTTFYSMLLPTTTIKVLQTSKKIGLLSFSSMIINDHCSPHTLIHTILSAQIGLGGTGTGSFSVPLFPIKSPQTRFLNHCK